MPEAADHPATNEPCYEIVVLDNYHHDDPDEVWTITGFRTADEALTKCRAMIDEDLASYAAEHETAAAILAYYRSFGDSPLIIARNGAPDVKFSAWNYAEARARDFARKGEEG